MAPVCDGYSLIAEPGEQRHAAPATRYGPPYLAVVVTARNDDHGGNLLGRMQTFVNALIGQARRHGLAMELIVVEWNPPPGKPRLEAGLRWPRDLGLSTVRILEVPPEVHSRYRHAQVLPLYQMIAKNVGIRRARGRFILATNIDILFSDELWDFLAQRQLESGKLYRIDRHDVLGDVPAEASLEEQLSYCRSHLLRVNTREGSFPLTREGLRAPLDEDIAAAGSGVVLGRGWYPVERHSGRAFRWAGEEAELRVDPPQTGAQVLWLDLEPGPGVGRKPLWMSVLDGTGRVVGRVCIVRRSLLGLRLSSSSRQEFRLRVRDGGFRLPDDPRLLNFRVFGCGWEKGGALSAGATAVEVKPRRGWYLARYPVAAWGFARGAVRFFLRRKRGLGHARLGLPLPQAWLDWLEPRLEGGGLSVASGFKHRHGGLPAPAHLHTNGCGDFTLMAREHWFDARGYPELDLYSFNLDSVLCYAAYYTGVREEVLADPLRIYHMEHAAGWTPEGETRLFERLAKQGIPWVSYHELMKWATVMHRFQAPMIFNRENWGLADLDIREAVVRPRSPAPDAPGTEE